MMRWSDFLESTSWDLPFAILQNSLGKIWLSKHCQGGAVSPLKIQFPNLLLASTPMSPLLGNAQSYHLRWPAWMPSRGRTIWFCLESGPWRRATLHHRCILGINRALATLLVSVNLQGWIGVENTEYTASVSNNFMMPSPWWFMFQLLKDVIAPIASEVLLFLESKRAALAFSQLKQWATKKT